MDNGCVDEAPTYSVLSAEVVETLQWCLRMFVNEDEAHASTMLATPRYRPLTVSVAQSLHSLLEYQPLNAWPEGSQELVDHVIQSLMFRGSPAVPVTR